MTVSRCFGNVSIVSKSEVFGLDELHRPYRLFYITIHEHIHRKRDIITESKRCINDFRTVFNSFPTTII